VALNLLFGAHKDNELREKEKKCFILIWMYWMKLCQSWCMHFKFYCVFKLWQSWNRLKKKDKNAYIAPWVDGMKLCQSWRMIFKFYCLFELWQSLNRLKKKGTKMPISLHG